jgi:Kdo2-lipid IVA lauroyltransferase/acyltransferase
MLRRILIYLWRLMGRLPLRWLHATGRLLGLLYDLIPNRERRVTQINLEICYPSMEAQQRDRMRRKVLQEIGCSMLEVSYIWFRPMSQVSSLVRAVSGESLLQREPGRGLIILLPHLGCWEVLGLTLPSDEKITSLYQPPNEPLLESLVKQARERNGSTLVPTDSQGIKQIYTALQAGGVTCILPDQIPKTKAAHFAPFFGRPVLTMMLVNRLVRKTGAKVIFGFAERLPRGSGYHIHYSPAPDGIGDADADVAATALNLGLERLIQEKPEQYQWSYKRYNNQPEGMELPY